VQNELVIQVILYVRNMPIKILHTWQLKSLTTQNKALTGQRIFYTPGIVPMAISGWPNEALSPA